MTAKSATCPPNEILSDFGLGKLDAASSETVGAHLETCADCRQVVAGLSGDSFVDRLRNAQGQPPINPAQPARARTFAAGESIPNRVESSDTSLPASGQLAGASATGRTPPPANIPPELADHPDYEVVKELGRGGMGVVYLARNRMMDRLEVLKVVSKSLLDRPGALERFQQEIRSAAKLAHPNIVAAYTVLRPGDLLVFAMEYVNGQDLSQVVKQRGALPVTNATFYAQQVALGLQHAHEKGMVHRDVKPNNLMLAIVNKKHVVKILDFGLAKATSEKNADAGLTKSGQMLGTPDYIAPEQTLDAQKADIRADIYSLGCTLYYLLAGHTPFQGNSLYEILQAHHQVNAQPLNLVRPEVPVELATVVSKMMAKEPAQRFQTPMEVAKALNPFFKAGAQAAARVEMLLPPADSIMPQAAIPARPAESIAQAVPVIVPATPLPVAQPIPVAASPLASLEAIDSAPSSRSRKKSKVSRRRISIPMAIGLLLAAIGIAAGLIFKFRTADGTVVVSVNVANPEVLVDGNRLTVTWAEGGKQAEIHVPPGSHKIELTKDGFKAFGETVSIADGSQELLAATLDPLVGWAPPTISGPSMVGGAHPTSSKPTVSVPSPGREPGDAPPVAAAGATDGNAQSVAVAAISKEKYQWPSGTPAPAIAPFDAKQARAHQEAWAKHLGVPVERTNSIGMKLVLIPPGEFTMGSNAEQITAARRMYDDAKTSSAYSSMRLKQEPAHHVTLVKPFGLAMTEVTVGQFKTFVQATNYVTQAEKAGFGNSSLLAADDKIGTGHTKMSWRTPGYSVENTSPVVQVTWNDAAQFCNWLSDQEKLRPCYHQDDKDGWAFSPGPGYRLPTEAEWEYACRAGTATQFTFGDDPSMLGAHAWYGENEGGTKAVGLKAANAFGVFDMHGNVQEWCNDFFAPDYYLNSPAVDPFGPSFGSARAIRGGFWNSEPYLCRSARRGGFTSTFRASVLGFRVARTFDSRPGTDNADSPPITGGNAANVIPANSGVTEIGPAAPDASTENKYRWPPGTPQPAIAPFDAKQARAHQEAWAKYLGVPVETSNSIGTKLVLIPPGEFTMGSTPEQMQVVQAMYEKVNVTKYDHRVDRETPQRRIGITKPYWIGRTEVTVAEFRQFVDASRYVTDCEKQGGGYRYNRETQESTRDPAINWRTPNHTISDQDAVSMVSWNDAADFCNWLSKREGLPFCYSTSAGGKVELDPRKNGYRLPTDAEWELACRAGTETLWSFGDDVSELVQYRLSRADPGPVATKHSNPFGLFDMYGNVMEWCHDLYDGTAPKEPIGTIVLDPLGPAAGINRVTRGGALVFHSQYTRSAFSQGHTPSYNAHSTNGFRIARLAAAGASSSNAVVSENVSPAPAMQNVSPKDAKTNVSLTAPKTVNVMEFDTDGNGKLDTLERRAALKAFDFNQNGQLEGDEQKAATAAFAAAHTAPPKTPKRPRPGKLPALAIAPFDAAKAQGFQNDWAKYLGVEVEQTNSIGMKLVLLPPGEFTMGRSPKEIEAEDIRSRRPDGRVFIINTKSSYTPHRIRFSKPIMIPATEITIGQFRQFVDAAQYKTEPERLGARHLDRGYVRDPKYSWRFPGYDRPATDDLPVACIAWRDMVEFCNWLSASEGQKRCYTPDGSLIPAAGGYRLPTEAEWEYACRAGTTTLFYYGDDAPWKPTSVPSQYRLYAHTSGRSSGPRAVGQLLPNQFGLYDMLSNVIELCGDWFDPSYYDFSPAIDPLGPPTGIERVRRGGNYMESFGVSCSQRFAMEPENDNDFAGFRVVRASP